MNVDHILATFSQHQVDWLLIGGMNFLLRHQPVLTFDVDLWVADSPENLRRTERALTNLDAEWGRTEFDLRPVGQLPAGVPYRGLSDQDMLACQLALDEKERKPERIRFLQAVLKLES